ncbi:MAG: TonB-dependent receptor [Proteobacteria bacterium]|nr:TonB-dependent receptor [Pseudomonadota bacterium]
MKISKPLFVFFLSLLLTAWAGPAAAEEKAEEASKSGPTRQKVTSQSGEVFMNIGEVTIHAPSELRDYADLPGSVDVIGEEQIDRQNARSALDLLRLAPGVDIHDYGSGGVPNGFTLRGYNLNHGSGAAITIDGIPYNYHMGSADGAVDLNQLIADDVIRIDVVKGPIDARYSNWNEAGVIHFHTRTRGNFQKAKIGYGDFATRKGYVSIGSESEKFNQVYSLEFYDTHGYRQNADMDRQNMYGKWFYRPSDRAQVGLIAHAYSSEWGTAGYTPEYIWREEPKRSVMQNDGGWKDLSELQLHMDLDVTPKTPLELKVWSVSEDYSRFADWGGGQTESHFEHQIGGMLANLGHEINMANGGRIRLDFGGDIRRWDTLDKNYNTTARNRTALNSANNYIFNNSGVYAKMNYDPNQWLRLFLGARQDWFSGEAKDQLADTRMDMEDVSASSYSGGAIVTFAQNYSVYANFGTGFELPVGAAKYHENPPGPADIFFWEVGIKATPVDWLFTRLAYFQSRNDDEIRWSAGEYTHQGETQRRGWELEANVTKGDFELFGAYTVHDATYEAGDNRGNWITSVPEYIFKLGAQYTLPTETSIQLWYRDSGKYYTSTDNLHYYEGFQVWDLNISQPINKFWTLSLDIKNLFDEQYAEYVGYWTDPFGIEGNQMAGSDGRNIMVVLKYEHD